jgi:hypothetical protein
VNSLSGSRELAAERSMQHVLPGCLPSGWSKLTYKTIVWRNDGTGITAYSGFGMRIFLEIDQAVLDRQKIVLKVSRVDGKPPSELDLDRVRDLFARVRRERRMKQMLFTLHDVVAHHTFIV